ncbi:MAG: hypothetical protein Q8O30_05350 [Candidatus Omnitrophota bacterium]|nr:hypothetical protein [Candidatus Omnitrophota bacterium]
MEKVFSLKKLFIKILLLLPIIYIGFDWCIGWITALVWSVMK